MHYQFKRKNAKGSKGEVLVLLITFFLTVLIDLTVAIEVSIILSAFLFMRNMIKFNLVIRMRHVPLIDATGIQTLKDVSKELKKRHTKKLILSEVNSK